MRKTTNTFGLYKSSVSVIVCRVAHPISLGIEPNYIKFTSTEEAIQSSVKNSSVLLGFLSAWVPLMGHVSVIKKSYDYINQMG